MVQAQPTNHWFNSEGKLARRHTKLQTLVEPLLETGQMPRIRGPNKQNLKSYIKLHFLRALPYQFLFHYLLLDNE